MHARHQFIFQAHCPPICFGSAKPILLTKTYFMFAHLLLSKQTFFTLKRDVWACHLYRNVFLNKSSALNGNVSLEWKCFLVTVKKNDPGVWTVYGASRHVKGWRKMTAVSHQDLTAFTKQLTPFWQMEIYPKERVLSLFFSFFLMFSTAKLFTNSFDLWFHLHVRWEGQPVGTNVMDFGEQHFEF